MTLPLVDHMIYYGAQLQENKVFRTTTGTSYNYCNRYKFTYNYTAAAYSPAFVALSAANASVLVGAIAIVVRCDH